ncbi:hypothetical protein [Sphingobium sp. LSP13-1-1.1]|uniref:hypothetical protein n=1 Tax=Sphingobium sp. LSP13-1-1.1 TaxID=3135234 RepID=UPI0034212F06
MTLQQQRRFARRLLNKIGHRSQVRGNAITAELRAREIERFLAAHPVQSAALYDIWADEYGAVQAEEWRSARQRGLIYNYDYRRLRARPVEWYPKRRGTSGFRKICMFGSEEKMWHRLARDLIRAQHQPREHIGDWRGRGRDDQMKKLIAAIKSPWQAVVVADIRRAFEHVNVDAIYDLPYLPEPLIRRAIDHRTHRFVCRERSHRQGDIALPDDVDTIGMVPSGLMEGSPASNAIFSVLMDDLPDHLDETIQAFVYCDNIILLAPDKSQARRAKTSLAVYLSGHRAGPFTITANAPVLVTEGFEHLGYSLRLKTKVEVGLSLQNWIELTRKVEGATSREAIETWLATSFSLLAGVPLEAIRQNLAA